MDMMNQSQQNKFSSKQLDFLHLSLEQAHLCSWIHTIEVTPSLIEEQKRKIEIADKQIKRPQWHLFRKWKSIKYSFSDKRLIYGKPPGGKSIESAEKAVDWIIDNFPDRYERECLKCMEVGIKPYEGLAHRCLYMG